MNTVVPGLARYVIAILAAFYTFHCFTSFSVRSEKERGGYYVLQTFFLILVHITGYAVLYLRTGRQELPYFCALQEVFLIGLLLLYRVLYPEANRLLLHNLCFFLSLGFLILSRLSPEKAVRQFLIAAISAVLTLAVPFVVAHGEKLKRFSWLFGAAGVLSLAAVLISGTVTNGSRLSVSIGKLAFQPSEFVKLLFIFFLAGILSDAASARTKKEKELGRLELYGAFVLAAAHVGILVLSRDLGGALIFFVIFAAMAYAALQSGAVIAGTCAFGAAGALVGYRLFSHVRTRVLAWRDPFSYIDGQGYQITQSLFAIGTGGWFGMGLMMGSPDRIPVVERDFIFSAISEELGCIFGICLILVCVSTFLMFMAAASRERDPYYRLLALGFGVSYGFQVFLAIGGVTKFIPLTGVTLPLVSYGGSSILASFFMFAAAEGISIHCSRGKEGRI